MLRASGTSTDANPAAAARLHASAKRAGSRAVRATAVPQWKLVVIGL
jgi:hypothetical protein